MLYTYAHGTYYIYVDAFLYSKLQKNEILEQKITYMTQFAKTFVKLLTFSEYLQIGKYYRIGLLIGVQVMEKPTLPAINHAGLVFTAILLPGPGKRSPPFPQKTEFFQQKKVLSTLLEIC